MTAPQDEPKTKTGRWITVGLIGGVLCGIFFGEYCRPLGVIGQVYVGLLQMTVLPFLALSLVSKIGRLDVARLRRLGVSAFAVLMVFWSLAILLVVVVSFVLSPIEGASFYSPQSSTAQDASPILQFIPTNVFRSLSEEYVPAVVVFCLFFGGGLMLVPGKERMLDLLDICCDSIGRVNRLLVRLAPIGLFALTGDAAGKLRIEELSRLQAYLIMLGIASLVSSLLILPAIVSSLTSIRYREFLSAAYEPMLTAVATGKLFVVLPQITEKCEELLGQQGGSSEEETADESVPSVMVPLAYPFPHMGKILVVVFIPFAAWYVGDTLTASETLAMATSGAISSFASPLITIPYLLDLYRIPQDLFALFIVPGFVTMRLGDVVGVVHLMALTLIVAESIKGTLKIQWRRLLLQAAATCAVLVVAVVAGRWYLEKTVPDYELDEQLLAMQLAESKVDVITYGSRDDVPVRLSQHDAVIDRLNEDEVLRVGYRPAHLPYTFFNEQGELVGLDVALMHRLANRLDVRLEFVPYSRETLVEQLESGEIDVAIGGLIVLPEQLKEIGFSQPYHTATVSFLVHDYRRHELSTWTDANQVAGLRLGASKHIASAARSGLPHIEIVALDSPAEYFDGDHADLDGLIMPAQQANFWDILYPSHAVVIPEPVLQRPVGFAVQRGDEDWARMLDRWLEFELADGEVERLEDYWVRGGGSNMHPPRWCILRDVLHWVP